MSDEQKPSRPPRRRPRRSGKPSRPEGNGTAPAAPEATSAVAGREQQSAGPRPEQRAGRGAGSRQNGSRQDGPRQDRGDRRRRAGGKDRPRREGDRPQRPPPSIRSMEVTVERGNGFVIGKRTDFDAATHKPVSIRYTLTREGLPAPHSYARLSEARENAQRPLEELLPPPQEPAAAPEPAPDETPAEQASDTVPSESGNG